MIRKVKAGPSHVEDIKSFVVYCLLKVIVALIVFNFIILSFIFIYFKLSQGFWMEIRHLNDFISLRFNGAIAMGLLALLLSNYELITFGEVIEDDYGKIFFRTRKTKIELKKISQHGKILLLFFESKNEKKMLKIKKVDYPGYEKVIMRYNS